MTERYVLQFPRGVAIPLTPYDKASSFNETFIDEFKRNIQEAFQEYSAGTNPDYIMQDKLSFIDLIRELNFDASSRKLVNEYIRDKIDEDGTFSIDEDFDTYTMESLIDEAVGRYKRDWNNWSPDKHVNETAILFVSIAIKEVLNYIPTLEPKKPNRGDE
jgi:hypothetical protein